MSLGMTCAWSLPKGSFRSLLRGQTQDGRHLRGPSDWAEKAGAGAARRRADPARAEENNLNQNISTTRFVVVVR